MSELTKELISELRTYNLRKLEKYEKFLLAKAMSEVLPLPSFSESGDVRSSLLTHGKIITELMSVLSGYVSLNKADRDEIQNLLVRLMSWRVSVAYGTGVIIGLKEGSETEYDVSLLTKYIDVIYLADLSHHSINCTHKHYFYKKFVLQFVGKSGSNIKGGC